MKIEKYKYLGNSKYKVTIDRDDYIIYEDIILKYSILGKKNVTRKDLEIFLQDNQFYEAYYKAVKYINIKLRCKSEIKKYLSKDYSMKIVDKVIERLTNEGYLNEDVYAGAYIIDQVNLKLIGPVKIENDLLKLGISKSVIEKHLLDYTKDIQYDKIKKIIVKEERLNSNKSALMLKNKILNSLISKGFHREDILTCIDEFDFDDSIIKEKEYNKIYNKLSKKYNEKELEYKIKEKMYQKGFRI